MSLKNVTREITTKNGRKTWLLKDKQGAIISAYTYFCEQNLDYAFATQKRYAEVVALFIDYLIEAEAFGTAVTKRHLNDVIEAYPTFLRNGSNILVERLLNTANDRPEELWLANVARALNRKRLKPNSFSNTLAAINRFLRLSESLAVEAYEQASLAGLAHNENYSDLITALSGKHNLSSSEVLRLRQNSMLGSVARFKSEGLTRPRRLTSQATTAIPPLSD